MTNIYFISGMGASCSIFDKITLPEGYLKHYLEWRDPVENETLDQYAKSYAEKIDKRKEFILIGYSFGGILVQEMNKYVQPLKTILIASIKEEDQIPSYFSIGKKIHIERIIQPWLFDKRLIDFILQKWIYKTKDYLPLSNILPLVQVHYMHWAMTAILQWKPTVTIKELYQIHGTKDLTFPYKKIASRYNQNTKRLFPITGGGHLMVLEMPRKVSQILLEILPE